MKETTYSFITVDDELLSELDWMVVDCTDGSTMMVVARRALGDPGTAADVWAAARMLERRKPVARPLEPPRRMITWEHFQRVS